MKRMSALMAKFRSHPPKSLGGLAVRSVRDYSVGKQIFADGVSEAISGPTGNILIFETAESGNYVAARPSGTEPKVKFYMFTFVSPQDMSDLDAAKKQLAERISGYTADMQAFTDSV